MESKWFGEDWGAECCDPESKTETPVGALCSYCDEAIALGDNGLFFMTVFEDSESGYEPIHYECFMRSVVGSLGHLTGECSCFGGTKEDPPELTRREAALAAFRYFKEHGPEPPLVTYAARLSKIVDSIIEQLLTQRARHQNN